MTLRDALAVIGCAFVVSVTLPTLAFAGLLVVDLLRARRHRERHPAVIPGLYVVVCGEDGQRGEVWRTADLASAARAREASR